MKKLHKPRHYNTKNGWNPDNETFYYSAHYLLKCCFGYPIVLKDPKNGFTPAVGNWNLFDAHEIHRSHHSYRKMYIYISKICRMGKKRDVIWII